MSHIIFVILLFLITVFLELLTLYIFFEKIYRFVAGDKSEDERGRDHSFFYLMGKVITYYKWIAGHRKKVDKYPCSGEMEAFIVSRTEIRNELFRNVILLISGIIIFGIIVTIFVDVSGGFFLSVFFFGCGFSAFFEWWGEHRKYVIDFLARLEAFIAEFNQQMRREKRRSTKDDISFVEESKSVLFFITLGAGGSIFLLMEAVRLVPMKNGRMGIEEFFLYETRMSCYALIVCAVLLLVCCAAFGFYRKELLNGIKDRLNYYKKTHKINMEEKDAVKNIKGIIICPELSVWEQDIRRMCRELKINRAVFMMDEKNGLNAEAIMVRDKLPIILCRKDLTKNLYERMDDMTIPAVRFLLGHELVHIYYKDMCNLGEKAVLLVISYLFVMGICVVANYVGGSSLLLVVFFMCLLLVIFPLNLWLDDRCSKKIMELRADRVGMQVSKTTPEVICTLFDVLGKGENKANTSLLYGYYKGYIDVDEHIKTEKRKREIMRGRKWSVLEYIRYMFIIQMNLILHRGWEI